MIGIVVVSHSRALAEAAADLASAMVQDGARPAVELAAGLDDGAFGTDAAAVADAVGRADSGDGVLVLLDLGSAVLSAEMAVEFLEPEVAGRVRLSSAPLVEGLVAAVVTAGAGADLATVAAEAQQGLLPKRQHLDPEPDTKATAVPQDEPADQRWTLTRQLTLTGAHGLHARPAARFVRCVNEHPRARVRVRDLDSGRGPVDGRSLTGVATLDARQGHRLEVSATGEQAEAVLEALAELATTAFGDLAAPDGPAGGGVFPPPGPPDDAAPATGRGLDAAVGVVVRPDTDPDLRDYAPGAAEEEAARLERALASAAAALRSLAGRARRQVGAAEADIFEAHLGLLEDPALTEPVRDAVAGGTSAPEALVRHVTRVRAEFEALPDHYQRERAQDVASVGRRVLRALLGQPQPDEDVGVGRGDVTAEPVVLVVGELDPATAVGLVPGEVGGVVTLRGGATGHGVLVARARGIPVLTGAGDRADVAEGTVLAFDVRTGRLEVAPAPDVLAGFTELLADRDRERTAAERAAGEPARTLDGHLVRVDANLSLAAEAAQAVAAGADGSGLVRTEVLFGDRPTAPSVEEQAEALTALAQALGGRRMTVRTWDVGGDKPLPFHPQDPEANPFLGVRGVRAFRTDPRLLVDQLEAICRVAEHHPLRVMFPMVSTAGEVQWALERLAEAAERLPGGRPGELGVGIMVEVPAAALRARSIASGLDFVSIGSNDLTQYVLAADRGNPAVAGLGDHADPAVLQLVRATCEGVPEGVDVCLCGDAASDPDLAPLLVGLGVQELSATTATVPLVKARLRERPLSRLRELADEALACSSAAEVRTLLTRSR